MATSSSSAKLQKKLNLSRYLHELSSLIGRSIEADELGAPVGATAIREEVGLKFGSLPTQSSIISFSERCSGRFNGFIQRLGELNPLPVYVWTPRTVSCGTFLVSSLASINFNFDFDINEEGMLVFLSSDLKDKLLLDFSRLSAGNQIMTIETQGERWGRVIY